MKPLPTGKAITAKAKETPFPNTKEWNRKFEAHLAGDSRARQALAKLVEEGCDRAVILDCLYDYFDIIGTIRLMKEDANDCLREASRVNKRLRTMSEDCERLWERFGRKVWDSCDDEEIILYSPIKDPVHFKKVNVAFFRFMPRALVKYGEMLEVAHKHVHKVVVADAKKLDELILLIIYVTAVTSKPHFPEISLLIAAFSAALGQEKDSAFGPDIVSRRCSRYRKGNPEQYKKIQKLAEDFLKSKDKHENFLASYYQSDIFAPKK
jgi:hypothetical protein